ncbi:MAG: IPT/TIG domain-containing protein [Planctomycetota bacterium]|jgi:hypothetical protein
MTHPTTTTRAWLRPAAVTGLLALAAAAGCSDNRELSPAPVAPPPPMSVNTIAPAQDTTTGGTTVTITGEKFIDSATSSQVDSVTFRGAAGGSLNVVSPTLLTVTAPGNTAGTADVVITNSTTTESVTESDGFTYHNGTPAAPTVTGISPSSGPASGGVPITITGSNFVATGMTITVGGASATNLVLLSAGRIRAVLPPGTVGPASVVVNNGGGGATLTNGFVYLNASGGGPAPTVTSVTPNTGSVLGGTTVTIDGSGFISTATSKPSVTFAGAAATGVTVVHAGRLVCVTPSGTAGQVNVVVTNPDAQSGTLSNGFTYFIPSPSITSTLPTNGPVSVQHTVTINGNNFFPGVTVTMGGLPATVNTSLLTLTRIVVTTPSGVSSGSQPVVVTNTSGSPPTASTTYTFNPPPTYASVSPTSGSTLGGTTITITGTNFLATPTVQIGGGFLGSVTVQAGGTEIVGVTPSGTAGSYSIIVTNPDGQSVASGAGAFTLVPPPTISNINPAFDVVAGGSSITITGTNFQTSPSNPTVEFGSGNPGTVTSATATTIVVTAPASPLAAPGTGTVNVIVTNADTQSVTLTNGFTYSNTPNPTSTNPASPTIDTLGNNPGTTTPAVVTINGTNFLPGATVTFGSSTASVSSITSTQIVVTAPASSTTGQVTITVTNPGAFTGQIVNGITYVADVNFQTRAYAWDTAAGIDCTRRWYVDFSSNSYLKDLQNRGLQTWGTPGDTSAPPGTMNATDQYALDWMRAYVLATLNVCYLRNSDGTSVSGTSYNITFCGLPPTTGAVGCATASTDWSRMAIGGCNPTEGGTTHPKASQTGAGCQGGTVGRAGYDAGTPCGNSAENNFNSCYHGPSGCTGQRGTFSAGIGSIWGQSLAGGRLTTGDQQYLDGTTTSGTRYNQIHNHMQQFAHRIAFVTAHEIGHSLGLVANTTGTGSCNSGSGQCGSTGSHNRCNSANIMIDVANFSGTMTSTSKTFADASRSNPTNLNSRAMLTTFVGISP